MNKIIFIFVLIICSQTFCSKNKEYFVVSPTGINLLKSADQNSKIITLIPFNSKIQQISEVNKPSSIYGCGSSWIYIVFNGHQGWVDDMYLSVKKPKEINFSNCKNIKQLHDKFNSNIIVYKNYKFDFTLNDDEIIKLFGKPNKFYNLEWGGYYEYDDFLIGFNQYFFEDKNFEQRRQNGIKYIFYTIHILNEKFTLQEIIKSIGQPLNLNVNCEDGMWYSQYENKYNTISYVFSNLNDDIKYIEIINKNK
jgi:hypothetical protein